MRKIKFRAWDRDNKKMLEVKAIDWKTEKNNTEVEFGRDFCQPKKSDLRIEGV